MGQLGSLSGFINSDFRLFCLSSNYYHREIQTNLCRIDSATVVLVGCQSTKLNTSVIDSSGYVVDKELLSQYSNLVVTNELEGRFYYTGADYDEWLLGQAYRKIKFTFHPDSSDGKVEVDVRTMQLDWVHADSVTIFIGKNKVVEKWQSRK